MTVQVLESHGYERKRRIWIMKQQFEVREAGESVAFEVVHRLRVRTMDEYAQALEEAGFTVLEALTAYPVDAGREDGLPHPQLAASSEALRDDRRLILIARR